MKNQNLLLSSIPLNELITVISDTVKIEFEKQTHQTLKPETEFLSRKETSRILGISLVTLNDWSKRGLIPSYRISSRIRYKRAEVVESMSKRQFQRKEAV